MAIAMSLPTPRHRLVRRQALLSRLNDAMTNGTPLLCVVAPAGSGKSTVLAEWVRTMSDVAVAWRQIEARDNDPVRFWMGVLQVISDARSEDLTSFAAAFGAPGVTDTEAALPRLINETAALVGETVVVLDDYHLVTNPEIQDGVDYWVRHLPPGWHVAVASRTEPALRLPALRVSGDVVEVRGSDLLFSANETADLLNVCLDLGLADGEVQQLHARTEGWVAGLHLAALSLMRTQDSARFIELFAGDDRLVVDYLSAEMLDVLPFDTREFLLRTSLLERLCGPLCDAVADRADSAEMLARLERENVLLVPLDNRRHWYRLHHLFGELLRSELMRTSPDLIPTLHARAAQWLAAHDDVEQAIDHSLAAGDKAKAAELVGLYGILIETRGQIVTVMEWLDKLGPQAIAADSRACVVKALTDMTVGSFSDVDAWLDAALTDPVERAPMKGVASIESWVWLARSLKAIFVGDIYEALEASDRNWELEEGGAPLGVCGANTVRGASLFWSGAHEVAGQHLMTAMELAPRVGTAIVHPFTGGPLAALHVARGEHREAASVVANVSAFIHEWGLEDYPQSAMIHIVDGELKGSGKGSAAQTAINRGIDLARRGSEPLPITYGLIALAEVLFSAGEQSRSSEILSEARSVLARCRGADWLGVRLATTEARLGRRPATTATSEMIEELTERELIVLRLMPGRLTLRELGSELFISHNTVKGHAKAIYRKLGVSSRAQAVARARDLGLL